MIIPRIIRTFGIVAITAIVLEIVLRLFSLASGSVTDPEQYPGQFIPNSHMVRITEGYAKKHINNQGLLDRNYSMEKPDSVTRILLFGDSYTEANQVNIENVYDHYCLAVWLPSEVM